MSYWHVHTQSGTHTPGLACYLPTVVLAQGQGIGIYSFPMHTYRDSREVGHPDYIAHITQRQARSSTHEHRARCTQAHMNTEPGALKHTWTQSQVHSSTHILQAGALKYTWTQRQAHSSTHTHTHTDRHLYLYLPQTEQVLAPSGRMCRHRHTLTICMHTQAHRHTCAQDRCALLT